MEVVFIVVVLLLNEPMQPIVLVLLLEIALCRVALGLGFLAGPGADLRCCDLEAAPISFGVGPGGPLVRESARLRAKLKCAGETDLPHVVSENFSKPGRLLEAGRSPRCVPLCGQRVGAKFCELDLQNALVRMHGDPLRGRQGSGWRTSLRRRCVAAPPLKGGSGAVRPAQLGEAEAAGSVVDSDFSSLFQPCMSPIDRHRVMCLMCLMVVAHCVRV